MTVSFVIQNLTITIAGDDGSYNIFTDFHYQMPHKINFTPQLSTVTSECLAFPKTGRHICFLRDLYCVLCRVQFIKSWAG